MGKQNPPPNQEATDPDLASIRAGDISFEEQVEIIGEINEVLEKNRIEIKPDTFAFTPKKQGSLIPLLINGGALVILAVAAFFLLAFFNREEQSLIRESATVLSAEGKLIQALRTPRPRFANGRISCGLSWKLNWRKKGRSCRVRVWQPQRSTISCAPWSSA